MLYRVRPRPPVGFIQPCLPSAAAMPPAGPNWIHEIKHDGFRIIKMKNPSAPAVKREAEEDWSKEKWR
jgi:bifunctional non-homologous end joining protein LigD